MVVCAWRNRKFSTARNGDTLVPKSNTTHVRWRSVALPTEHGGWSFISEPILLGLLLAPSIGGLALGVAALLVFLLRQPLKIYVKDVRGGRQVARTAAARRFARLYAALTLAAGLIGLLNLPALDALLPLLLALPLFAVQLVFDFRNRSRSLMAEISGGLAAGALAAAIAMMGGWRLLPALGLWLALALKSAAAILYVRARLRLERGKSAAMGAAVAAHVSGIILLLIAFTAGLVPLTTPLAMAILTVRAAVGLSRWRKARAPKQIGIQEVVYALAFVLLVAVGYWL